MGMNVSHLFEDYKKSCIEKAWLGAIAEPVFNEFPHYYFYKAVELKIHSGITANTHTEANLWNISLLSHIVRALVIQSHLDVFPC